MKNNILPLSHSSISHFQQCPGRFRFEKQYPEIRKDPTPELVTGRKIHSEIEDCIEGVVAPGTLIDPMTLWALEQLLEFCWEGRKPIPPQAEAAWALDSILQPCDFSSSAAMWRGVCDVLMIGERKIIVIDWKTGSSSNHKWNQTDFYRLALSHFFPGYEIESHLFYLKEKVRKSDSGRRKKPPTIEALKAEYLAVTTEITSKSLENEADWPYKPGFLCSWCDFDQGTCPKVGKGVSKSQKQMDFEQQIDTSTQE